MRAVHRLGSGASARARCRSPRRRRLPLVPSWLAKNHRPFQIELALVLPGDDVVKTASGQIVQRNTWRYDTFISETSCDWSQVRKWTTRRRTRTRRDDLGGFDGDDRVGLEHRRERLELLFHLISLEESDYPRRSPTASAGGYGTWKALKHEPTPWWLEGLFVRFGGTLRASFEGVQMQAAFVALRQGMVHARRPRLRRDAELRYFTETARDLLVSIYAGNEKPGDEGMPTRATGRRSTRSATSS